jgi:hypothetical protein
MCCLAYKGVKYHYAFEFKVSGIYGANDETFRIVISKYREETGNFSGLCLDNELKIISNEKLPFDAFYDIIDKVIHYTLADRKAFSDAHSGRIPSPMRKVEDEKFLNAFAQHKKSNESLDYFKQLRILFENTEHIEKTTDESIYNLLDFIALLIFLFIIKDKAPHIKDIEFFTI